MEPPYPCPTVFINEPFRHYPPCPSYAVLPEIPMSSVTNVIVAIAVVIFLLLVVIVFSLIAVSLVD